MTREKGDLALGEELLPSASVRDSAAMARFMVAIVRFVRSIAVGSFVRELWIDGWLLGGGQWVYFTDIYGFFWILLKEKEGNYVRR